MFKSHELNFDSRYTELCNTSPKLWVWVEAIGLEQRETRIIHRTPQPYPQGEVSEITEQLLARSFPNPFIKHSRWLAARRKMFSDQLPTLHILLARLDRFTQSIEHRLLDSVKHDFQLRLPTKAKIEKSLIGFLEAQAFTRAYLAVTPGEESDVGRLYEWWQTLWESVPFESLPAYTVSGITFSSILRESLSPSELLFKFLTIDRDGRFQDLCAAWMVTYWIKTMAPDWSPRLIHVLGRHRQYGQKPKLISQRLLTRLKKLGLPPFDNRRRSIFDQQKELPTLTAAVR